ncbi:MAG: squalene synthase HpnC [Candidatus Dormibacteria bacterium]
MTAAPGETADPGRLPEYTRARQRRARSRENFPIAAWLLRPSRREARAALYGFCRLVDDIGDERMGDARAQLRRCQEELQACYADRPQHPVFQRLQPVIRRHALPPEPFQRLIQANLKDQELRRYRDWEELLGYCTLSANPVGELVLAMEGIRDPERVRLSDSICTGLQLANMWQDVASDRARGRRYLPLQVLQQHGASEAEWEGGTVTASMRAALAEAVGRARQLLHAGWPLVEKVPGLMRVEMASFILAGLAASDSVLQAGDLVFSEKARLSSGARRRAVLGAAAAWRRATPPAGR